MLNPDLLHEYQSEMIDRLYEHDKTLVIADMGSGKTISTLTAITELLAEGEISKVLVLAPLRVASSVWHAEAANWEHTSDLVVNRALGNAKQRERAFTEDADIVVMNYENILWLVENHLEWLLQFDALVFDEVSRMKGAHKSKRYKALKPHLKHFKWIAGLTGTPAPNGLLDLYGVTYVVDQGAALGRTYTTYKNKYFIPLDPNGWKWGPLYGAEERIYEALSETAFVLDPADYDTRPVPTVTDHYVDMSMAASCMSNELIEEFIAELGEDEITVANAGVLSGKLGQLAQGFLYLDEDRRAKVFDETKVEMARELVASLNGQPAIIAYRYQQDLKALQKAFPDAPHLGSGVSAVKGAEVIEAWNAGNVPVLLLHPASAGHGVNLQRGGHHMIWYGLTWSSEEYRQAIARIARQGQENHVYVHRILTRDPYGVNNNDATMLARQEGKLVTEMDLVRGVLETRQ